MTKAHVALIGTQAAISRVPKPAAQTAQGSELAGTQILRKQELQASPLAIEAPSLPVQ